MKITIISALAAVTLVTGLLASQAQAHTVLGTLPKSATPRAVPHTHPGGGYTVQNAFECSYTVVKRTIAGKVSLVYLDR